MQQANRDRIGLASSQPLNLRLRITRIKRVQHLAAGIDPLVHLRNHQAVY